MEGAIHKGRPRKGGSGISQDRTRRRGVSQDSTGGGNQPKPDRESGLPT